MMVLMNTIVRESLTVADLRRLLDEQQDAVLARGTLTGDGVEFHVHLVVRRERPDTPLSLIIS
jgi:hypothetical protein